MYVVFLSYQRIVYKCCEAAEDTLEHELGYKG